MKIGIDIEKNDRFFGLMLKNHFMERVFTPYEREYIGKSNRGPKSAAGIFCVKEAFAKATGDGILAIGFHNVEVRHDKKGRPYLELHGKYTGMKADISISHTDEYSTAVCIIE